MPERGPAARVLLLGALLWLVPFTAGAGEAQRAEVSVVAALPVAEAWEKLQDFSTADRYVPGLSRTEIVSANRQGMGAHRRVYDEAGDYLEETVIEWRPKQGFVIKLHDGGEPMSPFERAEFSYHLAAASEHQTLITLALVYEMPLGFVGETVGDWFITPAMESTLVQVAAGMKHYYETGEPATDSDRERLAEVVAVAPASAVVPTAAP